MAAVGRPGLEPPNRCHHHGASLSPPRLEVEEEEEKGGWRKKKEEAAPLKCGAGFANDCMYTTKVENSARKTRWSYFP
jgi:hypothetical protein